MKPLGNSKRPVCAVSIPIGLKKISKPNAVAFLLLAMPGPEEITNLVLALEMSQIGKLLEVFPEHEFYLPPAQVSQTELQRDSRGHFSIIHQHSAMRADCYLSGNSDLAAWDWLTVSAFP